MLTWDVKKADKVVKLLLRLIRTPASFLLGGGPRRLEMPTPFALRASPLFGSWSVRSSARP